VNTLDGALLSPLRLVTIVASNDAIDAEAFFEFSSRVGTSAWWRDSAPEYHLGSIDAVAELMGPAILANVTDHDVYQYITNAVAMNGGPERDGNTLYLLYLPSTIVVVSAGVANTQCAKFGAYHSAYGTRGDNLAVVQRCVESFPIENMTISASHEIFEAATDPNGKGYALPRIAGREPWTESIWNAFDLTGRAELADLCESTFFESAGSVYQRVWSNVAARGGGDPCVPALAEPFYDTDFDQDWYAIHAGESISIPVRGWTAGGAIDPWPVEVRVQGSSPVFTADLPGVGGTLADYEQGSIVVNASPEAVSGAIAVLEVVSRPPMPRPGERHLTDGGHINLVGVYVP
jgi:hypothetical protein